MDHYLRAGGAHIRRDCRPPTRHNAIRPLHRQMGATLADNLSSTAWIRRAASCRAVSPKSQIQDSMLQRIPNHQAAKMHSVMLIPRLVGVGATIALVLTAPFCIEAQEKSHVGSEQVTHAIQELEKLAQKQIQEDALPGLAI